MLAPVPSRFFTPPDRSAEVAHNEKFENDWRSKLSHFEEESFRPPKFPNGATAYGTCTTVWCPYCLPPSETAGRGALIPLIRARE